MTTVVRSLHASDHRVRNVHGNGVLSARGLQLLLADYQIRSTNHRLGDIGQRKGFSRSQFTDAWMRYCPPPAGTAP